MSRVFVALLLMLILLPIGLWCFDLFVPVNLLTYQIPPGQWFYLLAKLMAQCAYVFLTLQVLLGSGLVSIPNYGGLRVKLHKKVGICLLILVCLHILLFACAVWLRSGHFPMNLLTLNFDQGYYNTYVTVGLIAACLLLATALLGLGRNRLPAILFRYGHRLAWFAWSAGVLHSLAIGSDTQGDALWSWFYLSGIGLVGLMVVFRVASLFYRKFFKIVELNG